MRIPISYFSTVVFLLFAAGCRENPSQPAPGQVPVIRGAIAEAGRHNVLTAQVMLRVSHAAAAQVLYGPDSSLGATTPLMPVVQDSAVVQVLGLRDSTTYFLQAVAVSHGGAVSRGAMLRITTGSLPPDLPRFTLLESGTPSPGFVMLGVNSTAAANRSCAIILNNEGAVVWYRKFAGGVFDFQPHADGRWTLFTTTSGTTREFVGVDRLGEVTGTYRAIGVGETSPHELRLLPGSHLLIGGEYRVMDLSAYGGLQNATVRGTRIQRIEHEAAVFDWNTFDSLSIADAGDQISLTGTDVHPWHANAVEIDGDGNYLVSLRNSDEILKLDSRTGAILWRLGGEHNQFTLLNDPLGGFWRQHGIRRLQNGNLLFFDNGSLHQPAESRPVEYRINETTRVAELVWHYRHTPAIHASAQGFAQRLPDGHTLICYGTAQRVIEVDGNGVVQWDLRIDEPSHSVYRAFRLDSLY